MDKRWAQLGDLLVNYSVSVKPGEKVMIAFVEPETYPLVYAVYRACISVGAFPQVQFLSEEFNRVLLKYGSIGQIDWVPEIEAYGMEWADVYLGLRGAHNLNVFWDVPADKLARLRKTMGKVSAMRWEKTRWCLVPVPNAALAYQSGVDEETITDTFFKGCLINWQEVAQEWHNWAKKLNKAKQIRIIGRETDLNFSVEGRTWEVGDGHINMPDGEIYTAPIETTVNGHIYFDSPSVFGSQLIEDIRLQWQKGKLIGATASTNQDLLQSVVSTDPGASLIGEFAFGTNPELKFFTNNILLDEKIAGTIHIALGRAYPNVGGTNRSAIHWDIVKDMRQEGAIYMDDELIYEKGKMLL